MLLRLSVLLILLYTCEITNSFKPSFSSRSRTLALQSDLAPEAAPAPSPASKGFGAPLKKSPTKAEEPKDDGTMK